MEKLNRVVAVRMDEDLLGAIGKRIELLRMRVPDGTFNPGTIIRSALRMGRGKAGQRRQGRARRGKAGPGGMAWRGKAWCGEARQARLGRQRSNSSSLSRIAGGVMNASDFRSIIRPNQNTLWRRVDWPVAITWGAICAVEFAIIYGAASYVMGAIR